MTRIGVTNDDHREDQTMNNHLDALARTLHAARAKAMLEIIVGAALLAIGAHCGGWLHAESLPSDGSVQMVLDGLDTMSWVTAYVGIAGILAGVVGLVTLADVGVHFAAVKAELAGEPVAPSTKRADETQCRP